MVRRAGEATFVAVLILFSAAALWQSYGIAGFSKWSSPGVFPMLASATMLVCGIFMFRDNYKSISSHTGDSVEPLNNADRNNTGRNNAGQVEATTVAATFGTADDTIRVLPLRVVVVTAMLVLYVIAMPTLGFLLCSGLFLLASISYLWEKPLWLALLVSAVSLAIIHVVFRIIFQVILPQGTLIEWLL